MVQTTYLRDGGDFAGGQGNIGRVSG